jgi:hypothetical protein
MGLFMVLFGPFFKPLSLDKLAIESESNLINNGARDTHNGRDRKPGNV